jgi:hypothetical protein
MIDSKAKERLKEIYENTIESGNKYTGECERAEYYNLFCKSASKEKVYKIMGNSVCMFNCRYKERDSVMMIFFIAINPEDSGAKNVAERVIEVIEGLEETFVTLDFVKSEEVKEDKFVYITAVKRIHQEDE